MAALAVLPFRAQLSSGRVKAAVGPGESLSQFEISYPLTIPLVQGGYEIPTELCTTVKVSFVKSFNGDSEAFRSWLETNGIQVIRDEVLPRINNLLLAIKASAPDTFSAATLRSVGELDLVFVNLYRADEIILSRATTTMVGPGDGSLPIPDSSTLSRGVTVVRARLMRAVDLIHHGYSSEAVLVAFALLDLQVQDFVGERLPNLSRAAGEDLLRGIERQRMSLYLGPLMRICVGDSPLDDPGMGTRLRRVNQLRNDAIHRAAEITTREAQDALSTIHELLQFMDRRGADFDLPQRLGFWTP
jgi:hypothetical protein